MTEDELRESFDRDVEISVNLGVPAHLYQGKKDHFDWSGRFTVQINDRDFAMAVTPSTLFVNEVDPTGPVATMIGSEWLDTPMLVPIFVSLA